jgi:hypothetical protein
MTIDETVVMVIDVEPSGEGDLPSSQTSASDGPQGVIEGGLLVAIGFATLVVEGVARAIVAALGEHSPSFPDTASEEEKDEAAGPDEPELMTVIAGASLNLAVEATRFLTRTVAGLDRAIRPLSLVAMIPPVDRAARRLERSAIQMNEGWRDERLESQRVAEAFADALVPHLMDAVIDRLDLTKLVLERVDLDDVVARVDVGSIIERVDLAAIVDRLDVDEIAARIDVERIIDRLDLVAIARGLIDELDLPEIIRGSTETMAAETRDGVRVQSIRADRFVSHLVDRALLRGRGERPSTSDIADDSTEDSP